MAFFSSSTLSENGTTNATRIVTMNATEIVNNVTASLLSLWKNITITEKSTIITEKTPLKNDLSVGVLVAIVVGSIIGGLFLLHCVWCISLYLFIGCKEMKLHKRMNERVAKMPKVPFVVLTPHTTKMYTKIAIQTKSKRHSSPSGSDLEQESITSDISSGGHF